MATKEKVHRTVNKSAIVREILTEIGALNENPPKGWPAMAEEKLKERNLKLNLTRQHLYTIRSLTLKKNKDDQPAKTLGRPKSIRNANGATNGYEGLLAVKELAEKLGGLQNLEDAVSVLRKVSKE